MGSLLGLVVPLALGAAFSPTLLGIQLVTLSRRTAPLARSWAVAAGSAVVLALFSVLALLLAGGARHGHGRSLTGGVVKLTAAIILVGLGIQALRAAPRPPRPERIGPHPLLQAAAIGAVLMLLNFSTLALFFPAMHAIGLSRVPLDEKVIAFALVYTITLLPVLGPPVAVSLLGSRATPALHGLNRFFVAHHRAISAGICFAFAVILGTTGLHSLLG